MKKIKKTFGKLDVKHKVFYLMCVRPGFDPSHGAEEDFQSIRHTPYHLSQEYLFIGQVKQLPTMWRALANEMQENVCLLFCSLICPIGQVLVRPSPQNETDKANLNTSIEQDEILLPMRRSPKTETAVASRESMLFAT